MNDHLRAHELLTWMVNGRIDAADAQWLNAHLESCAACREELAVQRRIREAVMREPTVEFAPQASFNRLWSRIEADAHEVLPDQGPTAANPATPSTLSRPAAVAGPSRRWRVALVAQAAAILALCGVLWLRAPVAPTATYRTVTDAPTSTRGGPRINAIFDDQVRLADVKEILSVTGLAVLSGPSAAGVYSLGPPEGATDAEMRAAIARLHADPRVRFAEAASK